MSANAHRTPKALREATKAAAAFGIVGEWVEGSKHHRFIVDGKQVLAISKGGNPKAMPNPNILRQRLQQFQRSNAPRS